MYAERIWCTIPFCSPTIYINERSNSQSDSGYYTWHFNCVAWRYLLSHMESWNTVKRVNENTRRTSEHKNGHNIALERKNSWNDFQYNICVSDCSMFITHGKLKNDAQNHANVLFFCCTVWIHTCEWWQLFFALIFYFNAGASQKQVLRFHLKFHREKWMKGIVDKQTNSNHNQVKNFMGKMWKFTKYHVF